MPQGTCPTSDCRVCESTYADEAKTSISIATAPAKRVDNEFDQTKISSEQP
jgi:hypothetical protein